MGKQRLAYFIIIIIIIISGIITLSKEHFPFSYVLRFGNDNLTNERTIEAQSEWAYNKSVEDAECECVFRRAGVAAGNRINIRSNRRATALSSSWAAIFVRSISSGRIVIGRGFTMNGSYQIHAIIQQTGGWQLFGLVWVLVWLSLSCCWSKGVEWPAQRCYVGLVVAGVQEQAEDILVPPLLRNCLTLNYISFS